MTQYSASDESRNHNHSITFIPVYQLNNCTPSKKCIIIPGRWQSKTPILSRNVDQKSIEIVFSIAICCHTGDKWESKTMFLSIFDPCSSIVGNVIDCRLPDVIMEKDVSYKIQASSITSYMCIMAFQKWNPGLCLKLRVREPATAYFS